MAPIPRRPAALAWSVFTTQQAAREGLTHNALRSLAWQPLFRGVHADSRIPLDHGLRCRGAALLMPPSAAIAGVSAAWLHGVEYAAPHAAVEVAVARRDRFGPVQGIRIHTAEVPDTDVCRLADDVAVTGPVRTAWDVAVHNDLKRAVPVVDGLLRVGLVKPLELDDLLAEREHRWGARKAARALGLADGRAESFPESELRVRLVLAGVPAPVPQHEVRVDGEFIARVDLAWPERKVALEYDGAHHATVEQMRHDRRRLNRLVGAGWVVLHVTGDRLRRRFGDVAAEVHAALAAARRR